MTEKRCKHCKVIIRKVNFALGEKWMHVNPSSSFPTQMNGGMWEYCQTLVAEPES